MSNSFVMPWTVSRQAPLSMGFPMHEDWRGLPFPSPRDLPDPGTERASLMSPALAGGFFIPSATWETLQYTGTSQQLNCRYKNQYFSEEDDRIESPQCKSNDDWDPIKKITRHTKK